MTAGYDSCRKCSSPLTGDAIAIYRKLINMGAESFLCINCLAEHFGCSPEDIEELIKYYRESGECTLFR